MADLTVDVVHREPQTLYGLWKSANDRSVSSDIKALSKAYHAVVSRPQGGVLPYFVLSRNYDEASGDFEMLVGSTLEKAGLAALTLPDGEYARVSVRPKLGFLWGPAIGEAKRYFYTKWLPQSPYAARGLEYERHTEESRGKHPSIEIHFAIQRKP